MWPGKPSKKSPRAGVAMRGSVLVRGLNSTLYHPIWGPGGSVRTIFLIFVVSTWIPIIQALRAFRRAGLCSGVCVWLVGGWGQPANQPTNRPKVIKVGWMWVFMLVFFHDLLGRGAPSSDWWDPRSIFSEKGRRIEAASLPLWEVIFDTFFEPVFRAHFWMRPGTKLKPKVIKFGWMWAFILVFFNDFLGLGAPSSDRWDPRSIFSDKGRQSVGSLLTPLGIHFRHVFESVFRAHFWMPTGTKIKPTVLKFAWIVALILDSFSEEADMQNLHTVH